MTSNYNVIHLPISSDGKYKPGDIFKINKNCLNWRIKIFEGLEIKRIDYNFGVRLHFDYNEWSNKKYNI